MKSVDTYTRGIKNRLWRKFFTVGVGVSVVYLVLALILPTVWIGVWIGISLVIWNSIMAYIAWKREKDVDIER